jgi:hypothetical protein
MPRFEQLAGAFRQQAAFREQLAAHLDSGRPFTDQLAAHFDSRSSFWSSLLLVSGHGGLIEQPAAPKRLTVDALEQLAASMHLGAQRSSQLLR